MLLLSQWFLLLWVIVGFLLFAALQILDSNQYVCDVTPELLIPDLGYVANILSFGRLLPTSNLSFFQALILWMCWAEINKI